MAWDAWKVLEKSIRRNDPDLVRVVVREMIERKQNGRASFASFVVSVCAEVSDGESCAEAWMETTIKHDRSISRLRDGVASVGGICGFVDRERTRWANWRTAEWSAESDCRALIGMTAVVARCSVVWGRRDWGSAVPDLFDHFVNPLSIVESGAYCDPLAAYHGMRASHDPFDRHAYFPFWCGALVLSWDGRVRAPTEFGIPSNHVTEDRPRANLTSISAMRFPALPHACLRLPDAIKKREKALNPRRAAVSVDAVKAIGNARGGVMLRWWGVVVGQFGDIGAMIEYAREMRKREECGVPRTYDSRSGLVESSWFCSLTAGVFSTGKLSVVKAFVDAMREVAPTEFRASFDFGVALPTFQAINGSVNYNGNDANDNGDGVDGDKHDIGHDGNDVGRDGNDVGRDGNDVDGDVVVKTKTRRMPDFEMRLTRTVKTYFGNPMFRDEMGISEFIERRVFAPVTCLLSFAYCDRYIPPDREDVQLLALDTLRAFVEITVPARMQRTIFEQLTISFAINCKWTMVRLLCQNVLHESWSPFFLPMTGTFDNDEYAQNCARLWMTSHGGKVEADGTATLKWMVDTLKTGFSI